MSPYDYSKLPQSPAQNPASILANEMTVVRSMYAELGFERSDEVADDPLVAGIAKAFVPDQFPHAKSLANASIPVKHYFETTLQPALQKGIQSGNEQVFALAHQVGRVLGAAEQAGVRHPIPPVKIEEDSVSADGHTVPFAVETGHVVEYGMGLKGFTSHIKNIQAGKYKLTAIHRRKSEAAVLQGLADFYELPESGITIADKGIAHRSGELLKQQGPGSTDLIIASRVHDAGTELRTGLTKGEKLLHIGGLLVARGPVEYPKGMNYNQVASALHKAFTLHVEVDATFDEVIGSGHTDPSRLIVARKI